MKAESSETGEQGKIDFEFEISQIIQQQPWKNSEMIKATHVRWDKNFGDLMTVFNIILDIEKTDKEIKNLTDIPGLKGASDDVVLAMTIQNGLQAKNSDRVDAVVKENYVDIFDEKKATAYLGNQLQNLTMTRLKAAEAALVQKYHDGAQDELAQKVLSAPDVFVAVAIMKKEGMFVGKGDFKKILELLGKKVNPDFKDVAKKLKAIRDGCLYEKSDENSMEKEQNKKSVTIYSDKERVIHKDQAVNYKTVFRIWATQIFDNPSPMITLKELQEIFPEFHDKLAVYDKCCDATGKIVKNFDFYKEYKAKPHQGGKRGGACQDNVKKAKEAKKK